MNDVILFLEKYWQLVLAALVFILSFILQLFKKKPLGNVYSLLFQHCMVGVCLAEQQKDIKGTDKLVFALRYVSKSLLDEYPTLDTSKYIETARQIIEAILSTPQKKF